MIQSEKLLGTKTYTLTVTTNPSSATCTLTYDGVSHSTKSAEVKAGTVISYSIYHSTYGTTTGSITMDKDKTLNCNGTYSTSTSKAFNTSSFTKVGSVSVDSSFYASGFTTSSYIKTNWNANTTMSTSNWEIQVKFKCSNVSGSTNQFFIGNKDNNSLGYSHGAGGWISSSKIEYRIKAASSSAVTNKVTGDYSCSANTWYTIKYSYNGSTYYVYINGSQVASATKSALNWYDLPYYIGICGYNASGSVHEPGTYITIDLNSTYIKSGSTYYYPVTTTTRYTYYWDISTS